MIGRVLAWSRGRVLGAPRGDAVLALALAAFAAADTLLAEQFQWLDVWRGPRWANGLAVPAAALMLAWRRRSPLAVLAGVTGAFGALGLAFGSTQASVTVFVVAIAVYSAAAYGSPVAVAVAIAAVGIWVRDATDPLLRSFGDRLWDWLFVGIFFGIGLATRLRHERLTAVESKAAQAEREHASQVAAAAEAERHRIARELHDIVSHSLGVLVFQAGVGEQVAERDPAKALETFQSIRVAGTEAIGEMATLLGLIRGDHVAGRAPQPRVADIASLVSRAGADARLEVAGEPCPLPAALELSLYRIAQEGLTNALKHAPGAAVHVVLGYEDARRVRVEVVNTAGSVVPQQGGGHGLVGLRERVAVFGGTFDAGPRGDGGWRLVASLPVIR